jgi:glycosyltransferase involved in cell wall biosynthesis
MADAVTNEYGISREKIQVIHNSSTPGPAHKMTKQPFAIAAGRFWDPAKNLQLLDGIAPQLDWQLHVAGTRGRDQTEPDDSAVCYLGALPHQKVLNEFERASLFLHPALYEPFGLAVLEAANARCCLALSDIPSLRELWQGAAVFIDPRDPQQWIFEVNNLMRDFELRESLASAAGSRSRRYQSAQMLDRYLNLYQSLREGDRNRTNGVAA